MSGPGPRVGFACYWSSPEEATWSGTPWHLRAALRESVPVTDLPVGLPEWQRRMFRLMGHRRSADYGSVNIWRYLLPARAAMEARLRREAVASPDIDFVLQMEDLAVTGIPYGIVQDLNFDQLLAHFGPDGVPHFAGLSWRHIERLRERQHQIYRDASLLFPMSHWLARQMRRAGVEDRRICVVPPGAISTTSALNPATDRRKRRRTRLLFVGRDFNTKAGAQVVAATELLRKTRSRDLTLTVVGPPEWPLNGPIPSGVRFLGPQPRAHVAQLMDEHDLFVLPSRFEGFGISFVESLSRGMPCIGRDACAMPEIIDEGLNGALIRSDDPAELANTIWDVLADDGIYQDTWDRVDRTVEFFSWARAARQIIDAVEAMDS